MASPTTISLVRHGHIVNRERVFHGRLSGFPLSAEGVAQAEAAARFLQDRPIAAIYSSPMLRARQTAEIIQTAFSEPPPIEEEPLLNEIYSPFDGRPHAEMEGRDWDFYTGIDAEYEQPEDILNRVLAFMRRTRRLYTGKHVVGVTHADPLAFIWLWVLGQPVTAENRKRLDTFGLPEAYPATASISTFSFDTLDPAEKPRYGYVKPY